MGTKESRREEPSGPGPYSRAGQEVRRTKWFSAALDKLAPAGSAVRARILADLREFEQDWKEGVPDDELYKKWDYKLLEGPEARRWGARQIRLGDKRAYRVSLTVILEEDRVWLLDIFRKTKQSNRGDVARGIERAKRMREEN